MNKPAHLDRAIPNGPVGTRRPLRIVILVATLLAALIAISGCGGTPLPTGADEPIIVRFKRDPTIDPTPKLGTFVSGDLPTGTLGPSIALIESFSTVVAQGLTGATYHSSTDVQATAVAVRLEGIGTGYWVIPVGTTDLTQDQPKLAWTALLDFAYDIPPSTYLLSAVAVDANGQFGSKVSLQVKVLPDPPIAPLVVSLHWDTNADLDLHLVVPSGKEMDPKHITSATDFTMLTTTACGSTFTQNGNNVPAPPDGTGILDRDSNAACVADGRHQEDVIFCGFAPSGLYLVRVDMFSACAESFADFTVRLLSNGTEIASHAGRLLAMDADGGGPGSGLFVMNFTQQ